MRVKSLSRCTSCLDEGPCSATARDLSHIGQGTRGVGGLQRSVICHGAVTLHGGCGGVFVAAWLAVGPDSGIAVLGADCKPPEAVVLRLWVQCCRCCSACRMVW